MYAMDTRKLRESSVSEMIKNTAVFVSPMVSSSNSSYDKALDEMEKLVTKRKQLDDKKVLEAYHSGNKTAEEIIEFIRSDKPKSD